MNYLFASALVMLGVFACNDPEDRDPVCVPNEVVACTCAGQTAPGSQTCSDDGEELGACRCCMPGATRSCACMTVGKVGRQDCSTEGQWGGCYACQ